MKKSLRKLYIAKFLSNLTLFNAVLVPFFTLWGKISFFQIMILQAWFHFWRVVLEIPTGAIGDYLGRKKTLLLAFFVQALAALTYASYPNFFVFLAAEFLWGFAAALVSGTDVAYIYDLLRNYKLQKKVKTFIANYRISQTLAILVASIVGAFIADAFGVRAPMLFSAIPFVLSGIVFLNAEEPKYRRERHYIDVLKKGLRFFLKSKEVRIYTADIVSIGVLSFTVIWVSQYLLQLVGFDISYFGFVYAALMLMQMIPLYFLKESQKFPFLAGILSGIGFILTATLNVYCIIIGSMLAVLGIVRKMLKVAEMQHFIPSSQRATVTSITGLFSSLAFVAFDPIMGKLVEINASLFLTVLGAFIIALTLFFHAIEKHHS